MRSRLEVALGGESLELLAAGAIHLPARRCLVVADAHFGKAATFRARGVPVPQGTTRETLARIEAVRARTQPASLVFLGDLFHAPEAHAPATVAALRAWREANASLEVVLVEGNHDLKAGALPPGLGIEVRAEPWRVDGLAFCHHPQFVPGAQALAGHLHPVVRISGRAGDGVRLPCFWLREGLAVLPAFGSFTGGARFEREAGDRVVAIAEDRLYEVPSLRDAA
ncbi:MAG: ligase-associated DNA damage response endonuclease PdeM [Betaproteobacteria bacterium]